MSRRLFYTSLPAYGRFLRNPKPVNVKMAAHKKKRRVQPQDKESSDSGNNSPTPDDNIVPMVVLNVDFDVKFPEPTDRPSVITLLQQLFFRVCVNIGELSDLLIQQGITSVIKVSDEFEHEDVEVDDVSYGVFSIVNLTAKKNMECIRQIRSLLLDKCREVCAESDYGTFKNILEDMEKHVGLIISERLVNIPAQIAVPLYAGLSHDIEKYKATGQPFDFAYFVIISKIIEYDSGPVDQRVRYANAEEELIAETAMMSFDYPVSNEHDSGAWTDEGNEGRRKRRVMLIPAFKYDEMYEKMVSEIGQA